MVSHDSFRPVQALDSLHNLNENSRSLLRHLAKEESPLPPEDPTIVTSIQGLVEAVTVGAPRIEIREHLELIVTSNSSTSATVFAFPGWNPQLKHSTTSIMARLLAFCFHHFGWLPIVQDSMCADTMHVQARQAWQ